MQALIELYFAIFFLSVCLGSRSRLLLPFLLLTLLLTTPLWSLYLEGERFVLDATEKKFLNEEPSGTGHSRSADELPTCRRRSSFLTAEAKPLIVSLAGVAGRTLNNGLGYLGLVHVLAPGLLLLGHCEPEQILEREVLSTLLRTIRRHTFCLAAFALSRGLGLSNLSLAVARPEKARMTRVVRMVRSVFMARVCHDWWPGGWSVTGLGLLWLQAQSSHSVWSVTILPPICWRQSKENRSRDIRPVLSLQFTTLPPLASTRCTDCSGS